MSTEDSGSAVTTAKFYHYRQNNSGGSFDYDEKDGISANVFVQAFSAEEADAKAQQIGIYFDGSWDCSTCGSRWSEASEWDASDEPLVYGFDIDSPYGPTKWMKGYETFVHYLDGRVEGKHK